MTTFNNRIFIGLETGAPTTDTRLAVGGIKVVDVSAGGKSATRSVPTNSYLVDLNILASAIPASVTQGLTLRVGTAASPSLYGTINSITNGFTRGTVTSFAPISGPIVFDVTASVAASASQFDAGQFRIRATFAPTE